ncbi:hypothetical protein [Agromyces aureus]|uniref:hypothetical protein n=1 Tax=Agromyces aureus TaxID=453304 RepID=UPI0012601E75|nr:hypothetical protein [Agromyces aureus]
MLALIFGLVAIVLAVIPFAALIAWLPAFVAIGLGIAALASKSVARKGRGLAGIILGTVAFLFAIFVSVASLFWPTMPFGPTAGDTTAELHDEPAGGADDGAADRPSQFEVIAGTATGDPDDPFAVGEAIEVTNHGEPYYSITFGATNPDAADVVSSENPYNELAPEGSSYVLVPLTVQYHGDGSDATRSPVYDLRVSFATGDGGTISEDYALIPDPFFMLPELQPGESATGNLVFVIPDGTLDAGTWLVDVGWDGVSFHAAVR